MYWKSMQIFASMAPLWLYHVCRVRQPHCDKTWGFCQMLMHLTVGLQQLLQTRRFLFGHLFIKRFSEYDPVFMLCCAAYVRTPYFIHTTERKQGCILPQMYKVRQKPLRLWVTWCCPAAEVNYPPLRKVKKKCQKSDFAHEAHVWYIIINTMFWCRLNVRVQPKWPDFIGFLFFI